MHSSMDNAIHQQKFKCDNQLFSIQGKQMILRTSTVNTIAKHFI